MDYYFLLCIRAFELPCPNIHVPSLLKIKKKTKKNNIRKPNKNVSKPPLPGCKSWSKKREHCQCSVSQKSVDILKQHSNCILTLYKGFKL